MKIFNRLKIMASPVIFLGMTPEEIDEKTNYKRKGYKISPLYAGSPALEFNKGNKNITLEVNKGYIVWDNNKKKSFTDNDWDKMWKFIKESL